jgi:ferrous iron transport protein B
MAIKIALAGNPNSGKTTLFNGLTGSNQYVGNWPGVTVEKKEGKLKGHKDVILQDLPGIYSLSPYSLEEVVARGYLIDEKPDALINIVDASNLERNLYLTTQLLELGIPVVIALNMMDVVQRRGDVIDLEALSNELHCPVIETTASKGLGIKEVADLALQLAKSDHIAEPPHVYAGPVEHAIAHIEEVLKEQVDQRQLRWLSIKAFERDRELMNGLSLDAKTMERIERIIKDCELELDDDSESIITQERYAYLAKILNQGKHRRKGSLLSVSDRIDRIVTNRILALPIFAAIMFVVYYVSVTTVGSLVTGFTNDTLFGEWISAPLAQAMEQAGVAGWLIGLVVDGIVGGVGAVLGFVPQMFILFFFLAILEECGYMARIAFIMDRIFRKFGLSGKSFIPLLIGTGCSIPGIMASRTIENERDRRITILTTSFIPCGAKLPIIALIAGVLFDGVWWVAPSAYFAGMIAVALSGILLKKTRWFAGHPAPFVLELPAYHIPTIVSVTRSMWERGWSFIRKAGTVILVASIFIWFFASFGFSEGRFGMVDELNTSLLASIGNVIAPIFAPLGFGNWQAAVATIMGLVAKEEVVGVFGVLYGIEGDALAMVEEGTFGSLGAIGAAFTSLSAYSFLLFNLLNTPCFAAIGAMKREMASTKWTWFAVAYQTLFAYSIALIVYQLGTLMTGGTFGFGTVTAILALAILFYLLFRKGTDSTNLSHLATPMNETR